MRFDHIYRIQSYLLGLAAISGAFGLSSKMALVSGAKSAKFIEFSFFMLNLKDADFWVYAHWLSSASFLGSIAVAGILENRKRK